MTEPIKFCDRLKERMALAKLTQAELAKRSGVAPSLLSRIASGSRAPSADVLKWLAPVFGVSVAELVQGTDAEDRLAQIIERAPSTDYEAAIAKLIEFERRATEAEVRVEQCRATLGEERQSGRDARAKADAADSARRVAEADLRALRAEHAVRLRELKHAQARLAAVAREYEQLRATVNALRDELASVNKSAKAATLFSSINAAVGVATLATLFGGDADAGEVDADDDDE